MCVRPRARPSWPHGAPQERIMSQPFDGEFFDCSLALVLANRAVTVVVAAGVCAAHGESLASRVPLRGCAAVAAANGAATYCQYEALRFVSFVSVTLAKSAKLLPVLIWARARARARTHTD
jgi:adenosine 3'-phospho 5'-phosphosulfate transporter B2